MDEQEFRRMLDLFPIVRSRDYCVVHLLILLLLPLFSPLSDHGVELAETGSSSKGTTQQSRVQETNGANKKESSGTEDTFLRKLKMAAEKRVGATKAELFCKTFEEAHEKLVYKELNLDVAQRFLNAYER